MELVFQFVDGFCFLCTVSEIRTKARRCSYWSFHSTVQRKDVAFRFGDDRNPVDPHCPQKLRTIRTMKFFSDANLTLQSSTFRSPTSIHICQGICAETIHCFERFLAPHRSIDRYSHAIRQNIDRSFFETFKVNESLLSSTMLPNYFTGKLNNIIVRMLHNYSPSVGCAYTTVKP